MSRSERAAILVRRGFRPADVAQELDLSLPAVVNACRRRGISRDTYLTPHRMSVLISVPQRERLAEMATERGTTAIEMLQEIVNRALKA